MPIQIADTTSGGDPTPSIPSTSGMNVANVTTEPGPLPGTPQVNPNENPYASAPFKADEAAAAQMGDFANKAADYINNVKAAQQASSVDTARTQYETKQMKSINDINAQARTEGWSDDQDRIQLAYKNAHDQNWADTVGQVTVTNPQVQRMTAKLLMASGDESAKRGNAFYLQEVQSSTLTKAQTQSDQNGQQLQLASQPQPGDSPEETQAKTIAALQAYHSAQAELSTNPQFKAILPAGQLNNLVTQESVKTMSQFLLAQRMSLNDPTGAASGYNTDQNNNDVLQQQLKDRFNEIVDNTGIITGPLADVKKAEFAHEANQTRNTMENQAFRDQNNAQKDATQQWNIKLDELGAKMSLDAYNNVLDPGKVIKYRDQTLLGIAKDPTLDADSKRDLAARVTMSYTDTATKLQHQQDEITQRNNQITAGVALGQESDINKHWATVVQLHPELTGVSLGQMNPDQQRQAVGLIAQTYNGKLPAPLKDSLEGDVASNDPTRLQGAATAYGLLQNTNKLAGISTLKPETQTALQMVNDHMPIDQVQQYLTRVNTEKTSMPAGKDANADYRTQVTALTKGRVNMAPADKSYLEYQPFYKAAGLSGSSNQPLPDHIQADADILTQNIMQSQPGLKIRDAQQQAAAIMQANGLGMTSLNGGSKPSVAIRSAESVAGTNSQVLDADIRHNYTSAGEPLPPDAKLVVTPTTTIALNANGGPMTRMKVQFLDAHGALQTPLHQYYWDPQSNVASDAVGAARSYNNTVGEYNKLVDQRAREQGLESNASSQGLGKPAQYGHSYENDNSNVNPGDPLTKTFVPTMSQGAKLEEKGWLGNLSDKVFGGNTKPESMSNIDSAATKNIQGLQPDLWMQAKENVKKRGN